jgi:circadian clock protein KaiB
MTPRHDAKEQPMQDPIIAFEELLAKSSAGKYVLRLYVTGSTPQSSRAIENLKRLCEARLKDRYELTVVDLYETPEAARSEQVICAPTLVKQLPPPVRRLIGDLSNTHRVLLALDIKPETE